MPPITSGADESSPSSPASSVVEAGATVVVVTAWVVSVAGAIREAWLGDGAPSALFVHGRADLSVSFESAEAAVAAIGSTGAETELVVVRGAGHEITGVPPNEVVTAVADWLFVYVATACG